MARFIMFTRSNGSPIYVNPDNIAHFATYGKTQTRITFVYNSESAGDMYAVIVNEPIDQVWTDIVNKGK